MISKNAVRSCFRTFIGSLLRKDPSLSCSFCFRKIGSYSPRIARLKAVFGMGKGLFSTILRYLINVSRICPSFKADFGMIT